jgi:LppX_LprAFG lipoprotein
VNLKRLGASIAALCLLLAAGCGSDGSATDSAGLTRANFSSEVSKAQLQAQTAHLEASINAQGQRVSMSGDMDMTRNDVALDMSMTGAAMGMGGARFILVDKVVYLQMPGLTQSDKYIKVDTGSSGDPIAQMFNQMLSQLNPTQAFQAFDAITKLDKRGTQEIDGVQTTRYAVTVDTQKALQAQGLAGKVPPGQLPQTLRYDVWVDAQHLVRKLQMNIQGSSVDMTLSQWGEPVDISAPPASQTTSMGGLASQMMGSTAG